MVIWVIAAVDLIVGLYLLRQTRRQARHREGVLVVGAMLIVFAVILGLVAARPHPHHPKPPRQVPSPSSGEAV